MLAPNGFSLVFHPRVAIILQHVVFGLVWKKRVLGELWIVATNQIALSDKWSFHCLTSQGCAPAPKIPVSMAIACAKCFKKLLLTLQWRNWQQSHASAETGVLIRTHLKSQWNHAAFHRSSCPSNSKSVFVLKVSTFHLVMLFTCLATRPPTFYTI